MTSDDRNAYAKYRLEKAEEAYNAAEVLILHQQWNAAINRLYYSAYYAVSGILAKMGIETKTTLLDIFQISAEMYCRTLFGNDRRTGFGGTLTSKLKNVQ